MLGGRTIETDEQARSFTAAMRAHPEVWTPRDMEPGPIRVGETIELEPCVAPDYAERYGRDCPRVELWPENEAAASLVFAALPEHTRGLLQAYAEAVTAEMEEIEGRAVVLRAFRALQGEAVAGWLAAQYAAPEGDS